MNGEEFINFASRLSQQSSVGAAGYRSAVSRAYYGAFHVARDLLTRFQYVNRDKMNEQEWIQRHFLNCTSHDAVAVGRSLQNLHASRKCADYDVGVAAADTQQNAQTCVLRADRIRDEIRKLSAAAVQITIKAEMDAFRQRAHLT